MTGGRALLAIGALCSLAAALLHLAAITGGPAWYRALGAGEPMARAAERGSAMPALLTLGIALILCLWAGYAASGAGLVSRLPLLRTGLVAVTFIYLARGMVLFMPALLRRPDLSPEFLRWSSLICLGIGAVHAVGLILTWPLLATKAQ
ncbi:MAG TPA: hypothetical protein VHG29_13230 [Novosphingobium sp.]|nr:hypothetical protein [Novosphingobium sp.]